MNKKAYMQPVAATTVIAASEMICTSGPEVGGTTSNPDDLLSRERRQGYSVWGDEDEEE